jgi:long-chain fatty acid transport protein
MKAHSLQSLAVYALIGAATLVGTSTARASSPLEYPDNGAAQFSRGGAWLALANEPIATHYNPAALAIQGSGFSIDQQLNFQRICYDRRGADGQEEVASTGLQYAPVCNSRGSFPSTIPSIAIAWRASKKLGFGIAVVPPAAYGTPRSAFPALTEGFNQNIANCLASGKTAAQCGSASPAQLVPAPYRYQQLDQLTTIIFPTIGVGYEIVPKFRIGAAFISGIAVIDTSVAGIQSEGVGNMTDHAKEDTLSTLRTKDLFVPGAILSLHWSPLPQLDVAAWGRWISDVSTTQGDLSVQTFPYNAPQFNATQPICREQDASMCKNSTSTPNEFTSALRKFDFPYPPEVRIGLRYHQLRSMKDEKHEMGVTDQMPKRDPLHEDVFDVELDGSYAMNTAANTIQVRFADLNGAPAIPLKPLGFLPPNADKWNGYQNSFGVRFGGQINAVPDKFGIRLGTWIETQAQDPKWLSIATVPSLRGGFGGGLVFRQDFIDISIGYQMQWAQGLNNDGVGAMRSVVGQATTGNNFPPFNTNNEPAGVSAANRTQFRSVHFVNDGRVTQSAQAFTLGGTVRF